MAFSCYEKARMRGLDSMFVVGRVAGGVDDPPTAIDVAAHLQWAVDRDIACEMYRCRLQAHRRRPVQGRSGFPAP